MTPFDQAATSPPAQRLFTVALPGEVAHRRAAASARCLRVAVVHRCLRRVLELTGADQILDIYPTLAAATGPARERDATRPGRRQYAGWAGDHCA